jgi:hypothetical protein
MFRADGSPFTPLVRGSTQPYDWLISDVWTIDWPVNSTTLSLWALTRPLVEEGYVGVKSGQERVVKQPRDDFN